MQKVVLATGNAGKVRELASLLSDFGLDVVAQTDLGVDSAEETGLTFIENAILKARHAAQITGLPAIADDSGLAVNAQLAQVFTISPRHQLRADAVGADHRQVHLTPGIGVEAALAGDLLGAGL